jgi:hypothetical protein
MKSTKIETSGLITLNAGIQPRPRKKDGQLQETHDTGQGDAS